MASKKPKYPHRLTKRERLSRNKWIEVLFDQGITLKSNPLKALFLINQELQLPQILITIPKRNFKKASARNLLKRRIREAYRLNKHLLKLKDGQNPMIAYIYLAAESQPFASIEKSVRETLQRMNEMIQKDEKPIQK